MIKDCIQALAELKETTQNSDRYTIFSCHEIRGILNCEDNL